jgi:hypothetical protein
MGLRFDINIANWIAYVLQSDAKIPGLTSDISEKEVLDVLLRKLDAGFRSSARRKEEFTNKVSQARLKLERYKWDSRGIAGDVLRDIRADLGDRAWTALIVPSWTDREIDHFLCADNLLRRLVEPSNSVAEASYFSGLVLQLEQPERPDFPLVDVFPAFQTALNNSHRWPGVLVWTSRSQSGFFPVPFSGLNNGEETVQYILDLIKELNRNAKLDPVRVPGLPERAETQRLDYSQKVLNIIQVSDIHLGTKEANRRLPQLQRWIRQLSDELKKSGPVIPIVTGDLMDTNDDDCVARAQLFMDFLSNLGTERPKVLLGNHDVRRGGIINEDFRAAMNLYVDPPHVHWYDDHKIGLVCFNSALGGDLARGEITEQQKVYLGNLIAQKNVWRDYVLVAALHHHPIKMELPDWYVRPFYEKVFGGWFGNTDKLIDADEFIDFVENHHMGVVIHGHKHIPKISETPVGRIPVFGCGSSVGKVRRKNRKTYLSLNVISIDTTQMRLTGRLLAQPIGGGAYHEEGSDEWFLSKAKRFFTLGEEPHEHQLIYRRSVPASRL